MSSYFIFSCLFCQIYFVTYIIFSLTLIIKHVGWGLRSDLHDGGLCWSVQEPSSWPKIYWGSFQSVRIYLFEFAQAQRHVCCWLPDADLRLLPVLCTAWTLIQVCKNQHFTKPLNRGTSAIYLFFASEKATTHFTFFNWFVICVLMMLSYFYLLCYFFWASTFFFMLFGFLWMQLMFFYLNIFLFK